MRNTGSHALFVADLQFRARLIGKSMFLVPEKLETCRQTKKHCFRNKNVSELVWKHFSFPESKILFSQKCFEK